MSQRLTHDERLHAIMEAVTKEGSRHGRRGWVTATVVRHAMGMKGSSYVKKLLDELHDAGRLLRTRTERPYQTIRTEYRPVIFDEKGKEADF